MNVIEFVSQPWHWSVSGVMISLVMFLLIYFGQRFGVSTSFKAICAIGGAGRQCDYFDYNWRKDSWLLVFVIGSIVGGAIASTVLASPEPVQVAADTIADLHAIGINASAETMYKGGFLPEELFSLSALQTTSGLLVMILGGIFIGFGTRWAGGCTSGHAISGLSNFQLPSLVAVMGFFAGGLLMTHFILPYLLHL